MEKVLFNTILSHVLPTISPYQFGFLPGRSCLQQLLTTVLHIYCNSKSHNATDIIYLDFSKAFDSVPHEQLLIKLWNRGISGSLWLLLKDYLTNRWQLTSIDGVSSSLLPVTSGVPQGSILGPLLFIIYVNDLPLSISKSFSLLYADDCKCLRSIASPSDCFLLQQDLDSLFTWSIVWKLTFNLLKCKFMSISTSSVQSSHIYTMNGLQLNTTSHYRDLGVNFTNDLSWSQHYSIIVSKAYNTLHFLRRTISSHHSVRTKLILYTSLIRTRLTYCSQVWRPHLLKDIQTLERVQRRCTKFILNDYHSNYKDRLIFLKLLPLSLWLELLDLTFLLICLKFPQEHFDIFQYVQFVSSTTRSSSHSKLKCLLPQSSNNHLNFIYFNRVVKLWNALPEMDLELSIFCLKKKLKSFFWNHFSAKFNPDSPCTWHYLCPCSTCFSLPSPLNLSHL